MESVKLINFLLFIQNTYIYFQNISQLYILHSMVLFQCNFIINNLN
jgi:hypothetical protein